MGFEYMDISGDAGVRAYGSTLGEAFESVALGMYSLITDLDSVKEKKQLETTSESHSLESLLVSWLNELIFRFDTYGFIGRKVNIKELKDNKITAAVTGEDFDPEKHEGKLLLKAATYHNLKIERRDGNWQFEVVFDV